MKLKDNTIFYFIVVIILASVCAIHTESILLTSAITLVLSVLFLTKVALKLVSPINVKNLLLQHIKEFNLMAYDFNPIDIYVNKLDYIKLQYYFYSSEFIRSVSLMDSRYFCRGFLQYSDKTKNEVYYNNIQYKLTNLKNYIETNNINISFEIHTNYYTNNNFKTLNLLDLPKDIHLNKDYFNEVIISNFKEIDDSIENNEIFKNHVVNSLQLSKEYNVLLRNIKGVF